MILESSTAARRAIPHRTSSAATFSEAIPNIVSFQVCLFACFPTEKVQVESLCVSVLQRVGRMDYVEDQPLCTRVVLLVSRFMLHASCFATTREGKEQGQYNRIIRHSLGRNDRHRGSGY